MILTWRAPKPNSFEQMTIFNVLYVQQKEIYLYLSIADY